MPAPRSPAWRWFVPLGVAILLLAVVRGAVYYGQRELGGAEDNASTELAASATLKARQLSEWYRERLDDATGRAQDPLFVASMRAWVDGDQSPALRARLQGSITPKREPWRYLNTWLFDGNGVPQLNARSDPVPPVLEPGLIATCLSSEIPVFGGVHTLERTTLYLDLCSPVIAAGATGPAVGFYLLRIDASQLLLPIVQFWPRPSETAATAVFHQVGQGFETLLSSNAADVAGMATARIPTSWPAGPDGPRRGTDQHGLPILGDVRAVTDTPWRLVVTIGLREVQADAVDELIMVGLLTALLVIAGGFGFQLLLQRRQRVHTLQIIRMDRLLQVRSSINEAIVRIHERSLMLTTFCEIAVSMGKFEFASIAEVPANGAASLVAWRGEIPKGYATGKELALGESRETGPLGPAFTRGAVVILSDLAEEQRDPWVQALLAAGHRAMVAIPISEAGRITGVFSLYSSEAGAFDQRDVKLFDELASDIGYALENVDAELRRRTTEAQLLAVSDAAPFAIFLIALDGARIERVNPAAVRQYGYPADELIGQSATMILAAEELQPTQAADGHEPLPIVTTHQTRDGRPLTVEVTTRPIVVDGQQAVVVVAVDVTERRQLEEQYRQAQRLEAVGQLAGGIAHDFNNLLTVIGGFATFVADDLPADSPARAAVARIQQTASRAGDLTRRILAFSRRQTLEPRSVSLNAIVRETAAMLGRLLDEDTVVDLRLAASRDTVNVDPSQMQQVVMNLAVNARDAMRHGGRLTIATTDGEAHVELRVSDTGPGIAPNVVEHIFEPFFTTKPVGEGTGLGLATVHGIVLQSGGRISVETALGAGTTFVIRLPRGAATTAPVAAAERVAATGGAGTIFLVEDDPGVRSLGKLILTRAGYTVVECANGAAALDRLAVSPSLQPDLLVTDVVMPGMSGPELADRLRQQFPTLTVLFVSGYPESTANRVGLDPRTIDLLRKPFEPQELLRRVADAIFRARD